ncbi:MAG: hypothetical protein IPJ69_02585 [Deltaproteobacteria bacterium]|nr:MAG: hypothetical protein IPJ69_02585 [Deltaproteobacteria bacterium]
MGHSFARITNAVGHLFHGVERGVTQFVSTVLPDLTDTTPSPRVDTFGHGQTPPSLLRPTPVNQTPAVRLQGNTSLRNRISSLSTLPQTREQMLATLDRLAEASRTLAAQRENNPGILVGYGDAIPVPPEYWDQAVEIIHEPN